MKLYITKKDEDMPGFRVIQATDKLEIGDVFQNSCDEIILNQVIESLGNAKDVLSHLNTLLRKNGKLKIYGIDLRTICLDYVNSSISTDTFNKIIGDAKNIFPLTEIVQYVKLNNLSLETCNVNSYFYELTCVRN